MRQPTAALGWFGISVRRFALSALRTASHAGRITRVRRHKHNEDRDSANGTYASPDFSSTLANLDSSIEALELQLASLRAALDCNDQQVTASLTNADHHAATLRDLIRAQRPDAHWMNRGDLDQLIDGMREEMASEVPAMAS
jgi:hypothetical protein